MTVWSSWSLFFPKNLNLLSFVNFVVSGLLLSTVLFKFLTSLFCLTEEKAFLFLAFEFHWSFERPSSLNQFLCVKFVARLCVLLKYLYDLIKGENTEVLILSWSIFEKLCGSLSLLQSSKVNPALLVKCFSTVWDVLWNCL